MRLLLALLLLPFPAFANSSPAEKLTAYERNYYLQIFDYVMDSKQETFSYPWRTDHGKGEISVGKIYTSKSKYACRNFIEKFTIDQMNGEAKGAGCKRQGKAGWCRVKDTDAHTCALEKPENSADEMIEKGTDFLRKAPDFFGR